MLSLAAILREYAERTHVGHTMIGPADVELEPDTTVSPDLFATKLVNGRKPKDWQEVNGLWLVAEVLSPSTARYDRIVKRRYYGRNEVSEYWVVDLDARLIERWHPGDDEPVFEAEMLHWAPADGSKPLEIDVAAFFRDIHGE